MLLTEFNSSARDAAVGVVKPALDIPRWYDAIVDGRPYASIEAVTEAAMQVAAPLTEAELDRALGHHPRIGERAAGDSAEAAHARSEQAGVDAGNGLVHAAPHEQLEVRRHLVVTRPRCVQPSGRIADQFRQAMLDMHVNVFERRIFDQLVLADLLADLG